MASNFFKALTIVLVVTFALSRCGSETRQARSEFVAGCTQSGMSTSICKCAADKVIEHYGEEAIGLMQQDQLVPHELAAFTARAVAHCMTR